MKTTRSSIRVIALLLLVLALPSFLCAQSRPAADLIIRNAKIWTVDKNRPTAEAVAVLGERIVAVGSSAEIEAWQSVHTRVIDAAGKLLLPGFNDSHVHFVEAAWRSIVSSSTTPPARRSLPAALVSAPGERRRASGFRAAIGMRLSGLRPECPPKN